MTKYKIQICRVGVVVKEFCTDDFEEARRFYRKYTDRIGCSTELFIDGKRLRYIDAWKLMSVGYGFLDFRSEENLKKKAKKGEEW